MAKHGATREAREARKLAAGHPALISLPLDAWQYEPKQVRSGTTAGRLCPCAGKTWRGRQYSIVASRMDRCRCLRRQVNRFLRFCAPMQCGPHLRLLPEPEPHSKLVWVLLAALCGGALLLAAVSWGPRKE
jgi:hypothetical protein